MAVIFLASGMAALIVQVVWTRWLTLVLGASSRATVTVLAAFMAGLGLGAAVAGRLADRHPRRSLALFGLAECAVGLFALFSIFLFGTALPETAAVLARGAGLPALPLAMRAALAAAALLVPTVMMGSTLPLLARWAIDRRSLAGRDVGDLYSVNTLGGAAGALLAGFVLIESLGLARSVALAGSIDLAVGVIALLAARRSSAPPGPSATTASPGTPVPAGSSAAILAFGISGFVGLGLEVVSHRVIAVLAGSSAYAYAVMLGAFLIGIGAGSAIAARIVEKVARPVRALGLLLALLALASGTTIRLFDGGAWRAAGRMARSIPGLAGWDYGFEMAGCLAVLLPATLVLGAMLPFVSRIAARDGTRAAGRLGLAYAANTLGAVAGTILVGVAAIPRLGTARTTLALALLAGCAGVVIAWRHGGLRPAAVAVALLAIGLAVGRSADPVRHQLLARFFGAEVLAFDEGPVQTIAVVEQTDPEQLTYRRLLTNQTSLTGTTLYAGRYMRLLGHLPVLWSRDPSRGLVICLGTGMTAAASASHREVRALEVAEISPAVVRVAPLFGAVNDDVLDDPRVNLLVEDGRHVLLADPGPFGFVTIEPPPPRDSGVVSLYTREFYRLAAGKLSPGGVVVQWIPLHSESLEEVRMLVASFLDAFPHAAGFLPVDRELVLIGSPDPLARDPATLRRRLAGDAVQASLAEVGLATLPDLLATVATDRRGLARFAGGAPLVTDDRPRVEYFARWGRRPPLMDPSPLFAPHPDLGELVAGDARDLRAAVDERRAVLAALHRSAWLSQLGRSREATSEARRALRLAPDDPWVLWSTRRSDAHLALLTGRARRLRQPGLWRDLAQRLWDRGRLAEAAEAYREALELRPGDAETLLQYGTLLWGPLGRRREGAEMLERFLREAPSHPAVPAIRRMLSGT